MVKVLITGGLGNLGSWLTEYFCKTGYDVTVLAKNLRQVKWDINYHLIQCDITRPESCQNALKNKHFDVVIHAASMNDHFVDNYQEIAHQVNVKGTKNVLDVISTNHFIYLSSFHAYGKSNGHITEKTPATPNNDYGQSKLDAEKYVENSNIPYSIIRLSNSYGCPKDYDSSKWYLILNDLSKMAFEKKEIVLKSNGKFSRDFIWMGDVCDIMEKLSAKPAQNTVYNLSSEQSYTLLSIAEFVQAAYVEAYGKVIPIEVNEKDASVPEEPLFIDSSKLKSLISYDTAPHFQEEAIKIFQFLENQNTNA